MAREVCLEINEEDALKWNNRFIDLTFETKDDGVQVPVNLTLSKFDASTTDSTLPIVDLTNSEGSSITEILKKPSGVVRLTTPTKTATSSPVTTVTPSSTASSLTCLFDKPATIQPMTVSQMPMSAFPANAIFAAGPTDISLRQLSLDPMPDYMYAKLKEECTLPDSQLDTPPELGAFYAAFIDERWERVQCIRASKIDKQAYCVYLLDVGAFQYVRKEAMRRLNSTSPFKKMLMFKCKIGGIKPVTGGEVWSRESHEAVREFFEAACGEPVVVEPTPPGWSQWKQLNAPAVPTCEARLSCCGRDIGDWLIACGLALPLNAPVPSPNSQSLLTFVPPPINIVGGRI
ncbi:hypothetical protein GCK72_009159 [Caenorhabditis remanei]|uniref:Tudor domain-containing protein n=1 Tax=Caenorhabditis remanei TaxID=31234 RepID=A0A6A5H0W9_CAERE|nr:hypothetical protein GCK72_009159 [Caenorhabditis remanei]KAF1760907.1 hypothetical protein GCK72_009159 [Caenorhabditis remanei]